MYELEVLEGLVPLCSEELREVTGQQSSILLTQPDSIILSLAPNPQRLLELRTAVAAYQLLYYKVPRPQMIAEGGHLRRLGEAIAALRAAMPFSSFRVSAAGSDSTAFRKMKAAISELTGLLYDESEGQLLIRFRRSRLKTVFGWEVLIRMTPLPLSTRAWRTQNMPGALNATIAAAMIRMLGVRSDDRFLNIACGSGTLLAERGAMGDASALVGIDRADAALRLARLQMPKRAQLVHADTRHLPFAADAFDVLCSDLPWGRLIGTKDSLGELYHHALGEMARISSPSARAAVITQENKIFDQALEGLAHAWKVQKTLRVMQSEYKPKIYLLRRAEAA